MAKKYRNSPERADMLAARAERQLNRVPGFTRMHRKPRGHMGKWDPTGDTVPLDRPHFVPAWINRRTGMPHEHARQRARALRQAG